MVVLTRSLVLAGVVLSAAACAAPQVSTDVAAHPKTVSTPVCADTLPPHPAAGPAAPMVPGTPAVAVACHYGTAGSPHLVKSQQVADIKGLQSALNSADTSPPPRGVMCPMDNGDTDIVIFAYEQGDPVYVTIKPTGCSTATNGAAHAYRLTQEVLGKL